MATTFNSNNNNNNLSLINNPCTNNDKAKVHLKIVEWLLLSNDFKTASSCASNHMLIANWLLTNDSNLDYYEYTFYCTCANRHLLIAQRLLTFDPKFNVSNDEKYQFSCKFCVTDHLLISQKLLNSQKLNN